VIAVSLKGGVLSREFGCGECVYGSLYIQQFRVVIES